MLAAISAPFFDIWHETNSQLPGDAVLSMLTLDITLPTGTSSTPTFYLVFFDIIIFFIASYSLISYSNRKRQIMLNMVNTLLLVILMGTAAYLIFSTEPKVNQDLGDLKLGFFLPAIALVFNSIANRFIYRDEKLVQSVDRLR